MGRTRLLIETKLKILQDINNGMSTGAIANEYGVPKSSICTIKNMESKIVNSIHCQHQSTKRRSLKLCEYPLMEQKLYKWFRSQRKNNIPINGNVMKIMAKKYHQKFYKGNFLASDGWLTKFKKRYGIRLLKETGEKLSSQAENVDPFLKKLQDIIEKHQLSEDAIFNADESGLYWKLLPDKTYVCSEEKSADGRKTYKERLTFLVCSNASGTKKIKLLVIGKSKNPRQFKNKSIPVNYMHSKSAWMNAYLFKKWFYECFVPEVRIK